MRYFHGSRIRVCWKNTTFFIRTKDQWCASLSGFRIKENGFLCELTFNSHSGRNPSNKIVPSFHFSFCTSSVPSSSPRQKRREESRQQAFNKKRRPGFMAFKKQRHDNLVFTLNLIQNTAQCDKGDIEVRWRHANGDEQSLHIQAVCHASYRSQG